ncbi:hypothetical protein SAMN05421774_11251 [Gemmobacter megaterium]|uniref:Uncharacterized protein n=1 Tax=Gemmobacter megaterium TaxID=1086013 RepID=A0A1N7QIN4_9RHOB|nr:hypothetical protein [Gemmobacter megaterium]GGE26630.1 hypothetical protein GCM10011345_35770 [Gemmobacter megaterium]SIT22725.1 hypothetical protein SAMN05421774_11251 [Gemmobacter megaterium]
MSHFFDGMVGVFSDLLGAPVSYTPAGGAARVIQSIFRESPVDLLDRDGHPVRDVGPVWKVAKVDAPELKRGDTITLENGRTFEVQAVWPGGSPASDAFLHADLYEVSP